MTRLRHLGRLLLALFALGALTASAASAVEGFLPLNKRAFTFLGNKSILETSTGIAIACVSASGSGTFESDSHGTAMLGIIGCQALGGGLFSLGDSPGKKASESLILLPSSVLVCLIDSTKLLFGLFIELREIVHIEGVTGLLLWEGSIIGHLLTQKGKLFVVDLTTSGKGKQAVTECKDEAGNTKHASLKIIGLESQTLTWNVEKSLLQFEEEVELMEK
jgi:hypothetical protein